MLKIAHLKYKGFLDTDSVVKRIGVAWEKHIVLHFQFFFSEGGFRILSVSCDGLSSVQELLSLRAEKQESRVMVRSLVLVFSKLKDKHKVSSLSFCLFP